MRRALELCREARVPLVVVLGDPAFYGRFGFVPASRFGLRDTYGDGEAFQAIALTACPLPAAGLIEYAPEFAVLD